MTWNLSIDYIKFVFRLTAVLPWIGSIRYGHLCNIWLPEALPPRRSLLRRKPALSKTHLTDVLKQERRTCGERVNQIPSKTTEDTYWFLVHRLSGERVLHSFLQACFVNDDDGKRWRHLCTGCSKKVCDDFNRMPFAQLLPETIVLWAGCS